MTPKGDKHESGKHEEEECKKEDKLITRIFEGQDWHSCELLFCLRWRNS